MHLNKLKLFFWASALGVLSLPAALLAQNAGSWIETEPVLSFNSATSSATFLPYWSGRFTAGYFSENAEQRGLGFFLDGTKHLTPEGSFFSLGAQGGTQQIENASSAWEGLIFGAGVGLGSWTPFLTLSVQKGEMNFNAMTVNVGGNLPLAPGCALQLFLNGIVTSHTGPFASLLNLTDSSAEVDELNASLGFSLAAQMDSRLDLIAGFQQDMNQTVKFQNLAHTISQTPDLMDNLDIFKLGFDLHLSKPWIIEVVGRGGWDFMPAGSFYSERLAQTVTLTNASTQFFMGGTTSLQYRF